MQINDTHHLCRTPDCNNLFFGDRKYCSTCLVNTANRIKSYERFNPILTLIFKEYNGMRSQCLNPSDVVLGSHTYEDLKPFITRHKLIQNGYTEKFQRMDCEFVGYLKTPKLRIWHANGLQADECYLFDAKEALIQ